MNTRLINEAITQASQCIGEYWPLNTFIATNPLWDSKHEDIKTVLERLYTVHGELGTMPLDWYLTQFKQGKVSQSALHQAIRETLGNEYIYTDFWLNRALQQALCEEIKPIKSLLLISEQIDRSSSGKQKSWVKQQCLQWITPYFDRGEASWRNHKNASLWDFWKTIIVHEQPKLKTLLTKNSTPETIISTLLLHLGISEACLCPYFATILFELRGYASLIKWLQRHPDNPWVVGDADHQTIIALWLCYEYLIAEEHNHQSQLLGTKSPESLLWQKWYSEHVSETAIPALRHIDILLVWQTAYERTHHHQILDSLLSLSNTKPKKPLTAQLIFCMDTRSEGLRRQLENHEHYQTFGIAGFFGFIFKLKHKHNTQFQCPALVTPQNIVETKASDHPLLTESTGIDQTMLTACKNHPLSGFGLVEMLSLWPALRLWLKEWLPRVHGKKSSTHYESHIPFQQQVDSAYALLTTIGLTKDFAPWVVICAHESQSDNNPFASALNCGACGGNSGVPNASLAAEALNNADIRMALCEKGMTIPDHTQFIAACHNTTTDEIRWLSKTPERSAQWQQFEQDLRHASQALRKERLSAWPNKTSVWRKPFDWADLAPELGLANNAALIIGPRSFTRGIDLKRRCFLHCYNPNTDEAGATLEFILSAPAVVAHWINAQYYFSTVNPAFFGAGNKTIHSIVGKIGVVEGNGSDLKTGLPEQSVRFGDQLLHQPQRLLLVVYAPKQRVTDIIERQPLLQQLIHGHWLSLTVIEPEHPTCAIAIPESY